MRTLMVLILALTVLMLVSSSPINFKRRLMYRPSEHDVLRRSPQYIKGQRAGVKGYNPTTPPSLRKGEYMCGSRVCKLQPGEMPMGCNGVCQYPVK